MRFGTPGRKRRGDSPPLFVSRETPAPLRRRRVQGCGGDGGRWRAVRRKAAAGPEGRTRCGRAACLSPSRRLPLFCPGEAQAKACAKRGPFSPFYKKPPAPDDAPLFKAGPFGAGPRPQGRCGVPARRGGGQVQRRAAGAVRQGQGLRGECGYSARLRRRGGRGECGTKGRLVRRVCRCAEAGGGRSGGGAFLFCTAPGGAAARKAPSSPPFSPPKEPLASPLHRRYNTGKTAGARKNPRFYQ